MKTVFQKSCLALHLGINIDTELSHLRSIYIYKIPYFVACKNTGNKKMKIIKDHCPISLFFDEYG